MKSSKLLLVPILMVAVACGGGGSKGGGGGSGAPTPIASASQGTGASAASSQSISLAANAGSSLGNFAEGSQVAGSAPFQSPAAARDTRFAPLHQAQKKAMRLQREKLAAGLSKARALAAGQRAQVTVSDFVACADGGSVDFTGTVDDATGAFSLTLTYNTCREYDEQADGSITTSGSYSATGTNDTFTMRIGDGDGTIEDSDFEALLFTPGYVDVYASYLADVTMSGSLGCADQACNTFNTRLTANGREEYSDFLDQYDFAYANLTIAGSDTFTDTSWNSSMSVNGGVSQSWTSNGTSYGVSISFGAFTLGWLDTANYYEETADGTVTTNFTPDQYCFEGTFSIDTQIPVRTSYATGATTAGKVVINGNTTVVFNADGTVTVTVSGQAPANYDSLDELESVCSIADMEPADSTATTFEGETSTTGSSLLATLTWTGGSSSDMDLHLTHYASTAGAGSYDWHVYFANSADGGYAVLDFDDTEGYGPEHITMETLPTGYYLLYVDPWSLDMDASATITVTLRIGGETFQFPAHTFYSSSEEDWRVADIRVESGGAVTILAPNTSIYAPARALNATKLR